MSELQHELSEAFFEDTAPLVEDLGTAVLELERAFREQRPSEELIGRICARLHTIKGNAGMVGHTKVAELAHVLEDACTLVDSPEVTPDVLVDLLLLGLDELGVLMRHEGQAGQGGIGGEARISVEGLRARVASLMAAPADGRSMEPRGVARVLAAAANTPERQALRIDLTLLDQLLEGLGEAISLQASLGAGEGSETAGWLFEERAQRLSTSLRALRELLLRARLVPLVTLFRRFERPLRDLSRERGLDVELRCTGGSQAVDKTICDKLAEPLLHLVRNAIAHGFEPPAERKRLGKSPVGVLSIDARADGERTLITVSDDGRGFDPHALRKRARALGIATDGLSEEECLQLALLPQVSTSDGVDQLSGRGVGLDAVVRAIKEVGGSLSLSSRAGRGTVFVLALPTTLSLVKSLVVRVAQERYLLPASSIIETLRVTEDMVHEVNGRLVLRAKHLLSWSMLSDLFGEQSAQARSQTAGYGIVVNTGKSVRAFGIDAVLGTVDVLVKPVDNGLTHLPFVTGAAVLGDGTVSLMLDPRALLEAVGETDPSIRAQHV